VQELADEPFALIGVNSDEFLWKVRPRIASEKLNWRSVWNGPKGTGGPISRKWNVRGWPTIWVLDADGVLRFTSRGQGVEDAVAELLKDMDRRP
jgi:hypothetical protein